MITDLKAKIRALVGDFGDSSYEVFTYQTSAIFTIAQPNVTAVTAVSLNGVALGSGEYSYDSTTQQITITATLATSDIIQINYTYNCYSDTEISGYTRAALVYLTPYSTCSEEIFYFDGTDIFPEPDSLDEDVIALVASIIINPNYSEKRMSTVLVKYPRGRDKETQIREIIQQSRWGLGTIRVIEWGRLDT